MDYESIDVTKLRVKELKKIITDAGLITKGITDKCELVTEAKKAIEILKKNPPKEEEEEKLPPRVVCKELASTADFDEFIKEKMITVVAFIDKSQRSKDLMLYYTAKAEKTFMMRFASIQAESVDNI